jgi:hypothetical protein
MYLDLMSYAVTVELVDNYCRNVCRVVTLIPELLPHVFLLLA